MFTFSSPSLSLTKKKKKRTGSEINIGKWKSENHHEKIKKNGAPPETQKARKVKSGSARYSCMGWGYFLFKFRKSN